MQKVAIKYQPNCFHLLDCALEHIIGFKDDYLNEKGIGVYTFDDFYSVTVDNKPFFETPFKQVNAYIVKANIHEWAKDEEAKKIFTLKEVLRYIWNNQKIKSSMQRNQAFRLLVDKGEICKDKKNNVLLYFDGHIHSEQRTVERNTI